MARAFVDSAWHWALQVRVMLPVRVWVRVPLPVRVWVRVPLPVRV